MPDSKVSQLPLNLTAAANDELYLVDSSSTPTSKKIRVSGLFGSITANVGVTGTFSVTGDATLTGNTNYVGNSVFRDINVTNFQVTSNTFIIRDAFTPANSTTPITFQQGAIAFDQNYIYVRTSNTAWKRASLQAF